MSFGMKLSFQAKNLSMDTLNLTEMNSQIFLKEQYQKAAASLLAELVSEDVLGYETEFRRVRYDCKIIYMP